LPRSAIILFRYLSVFFSTGNGETSRRVETRNPERSLIQIREKESREDWANLLTKETDKTSAMTENNSETPTTNSNAKSRGGIGMVRSIDTYTAQCHTCLKWRVIPTEEEYEDIRSRGIADKFTCKSKGLTCDDPADIEYDASRTWVIDKPGVPKTPRGFKRHLVLRRDFSKMDAYYITPTGKKLRTRNEISSFITSKPEYKGVKVDDFNFATPKVMEDTIPEDVLEMAAGGGNSSKKGKPRSLL
ncbi:Methyl-CpG-binding domain-containing protein 4, partial [Linum grandiflorum]